MIVRALFADPEEVCGRRRINAVLPRHPALFLGLEAFGLQEVISQVQVGPQSKEVRLGDLTGSPRPAGIDGDRDDVGGGHTGGLGQVGTFYVGQGLAGDNEEGQEDQGDFFDQGHGDPHSKTRTWYPG